ncbi:prepilin peptidase [Tianweitania populi]
MLTIFPSLMLIAAVSDILTMRIRNRVSVVLVLAFALLAPFTDMIWKDYCWHLGSAGCVLIACFGLFALGAMGGGDAKMLAATACWMGPGVALAQYLVWSAFLGGLLTLALLALRYSPLASAASNTRLLRHVADRKAGIPYGIALGAAGLMAFPSSPLGAWALAQM